MDLGTSKEGSIKNGPWDYGFQWQGKNFVGAKNSTIFRSFVESVLHFKRLGAYWPGRNLVSTLLLEYELYVYRRQYSLPVHVIITVHARETPRRYLWPYSGRWRCMLPHTTRHCCPLSWRPHP